MKSRRFFKVIFCLLLLLSIPATPFFIYLWKWSEKTNEKFGSLAYLYAFESQHLKGFSELWSLEERKSMRFSRNSLFGKYESLKFDTLRPAEEIVVMSMDYFTKEKFIVCPSNLAPEKGTFFEFQSIGEQKELVILELKEIMKHVQIYVTVYFD